MLRQLYIVNINYDQIKDAAELAANNKSSAIELRKLKKMVTEYRTQRRMDEFETKILRQNIMHGFYIVLLGNQNQEKSIRSIFTAAFGITDVTDCDNPNTKTKASLNQIIDIILFEDRLLDSFESECRKLALFNLPKRSLVNV